MADLKKLIQAYSNCIDVNGACYDCPYFLEDGIEPEDCDRKVLTDVLELLKEREPVKPKEVNMYPPGQYACGYCGHISVGSKDYHAKFCPECGRELKWDDLRKSDFDFGKQSAGNG